MTVHVHTTQGPYPTARVDLSRAGNGPFSPSFVLIQDVMACTDGKSGCTPVMRFRERYKAELRTLWLLKTSPEQLAKALDEVRARGEEDRENERYKNLTPDQLPSRVLEVQAYVRQRFKLGVLSEDLTHELVAQHYGFGFYGDVPP